MKYDVFISYSRIDTVIADEICKAFDMEGVVYFIDRQGIIGGIEFPKVLATAINESDVFLFLASINSYKSHFTDREITYAFNKKGGEKMLLYNIDGSKLPEHIELIFSSNNWRNLKENPIVPDLINDIKALTGRQSFFDVNTGKSNPIKTDRINTYELDELDTNGFINSFADINLSLNAEEWYQRGYDIYYMKLEGESSDAARCFLKAAKAGHVEAQLFLSKLYSLGIGVKKDNEIAYYWLKQAASSNGINELDRVGNRAYNDGKYREAYEFYKKIVDLYLDEFKKDSPYHHGDSNPVINAICKIGMMYENGNLGAIDYLNAKEWYKLAKDLGHPELLKKLLDKTKAETSKSIAEDMPELLSNEEKYELAKRYLQGNGLPVSYEKAFLLLKECSESKNYLAMKDLAFCYLNGNGCVFDYKKAYELFEIVANMTGDAQAIFEEALMLEVGRGIKKDYTRAIMMFVEAASKDNAESVKHLAFLYKYGRLTGRQEFDKELICRTYYYLLDNPIIDFSFHNEGIFYHPWSRDLFPDVVECFKNNGLEKYIVNNSIDFHNSWEISCYHQEELKMVFLQLKKIRKIRLLEILNEIDANHCSDNFIIDENHKNIKPVDLGLPSGILWADMNVGTDTVNQNGALYAWAETEPKKKYDWTTYFDKRSKGRFEHINVNGTSSWSPAWNCARVYFGEGWTIPKEKHFNELMDFCSWEWVKKRKTHGYLVTGNNGNSIFFPETNDKEHYGAYWTLTINKEKSSKYAGCFFFNEKERKIIAAQRCLGLMVRPIASITVYGDTFEGEGPWDGYD